MRSIIEVNLTDGRTLVEEADERYRGGPEKPFTREQLHGKRVVVVMSGGNITLLQLRELLADDYER